MNMTHRPVGCRYHPKRPATLQCAACGAPICRECAQPTPTGHLLCRACCVHNKLPQRHGGTVSTLAILSITISCLYAATISAIFLVFQSPAHIIGVELGYFALLVTVNIFLLRRHKWAYWACIVHSTVMLLLFAALMGWIIYTAISGSSHPCGEIYLMLFGYLFFFAILPFILPAMLILPIAALRILTRPAARLEFGYLPKQKQVTV